MRMRTSTVRLSAAAARSPHFAVSVSDWVGTSATSAAVLANAASTSPPKSWSINPATTQTHTSNPNGPTAATNFISPFSSPTSPPPTSPTSSLAFFGNAALGIPDLAATAATATAATAASTSATARAAWITAATPRVAVARQLRFHYGSWHWRVYSSSSGSSSSSTATTGAGSGDAPWRGTQEAVAGDRFSPEQPDHLHSSGLDGQQRSALQEEMEQAARVGSHPVAVLQVVERSGQDFDEAALVSALQAVADACDQSRSAPRGDRGGEDEHDVWQWVGQHNTFQSLLSMVVAGAERLSPAQATAVARSLSRLRVEDEGVLDAISRNIVSEVHRMNSDQLVDLLEAYRAAGASPGTVMADAVKRRLHGHGGEDTTATAAAVPSGRATADGVRLGRTDSDDGGDRGGALPQLEGAESDRVRQLLKELGYDSSSMDLGRVPPPRQVQSDRSLGTDYT